MSMSELKEQIARAIDPEAFDTPKDPDEQYDHPYGVGAYHAERERRRKAARTKAEAILALPSLASVAEAYREETERLAVEIENAARYIDGLKTNENIPDDEQGALVSSLTRTATRIRALLPLLQQSYKAGAEAMRERAAKHCLDQANDLRHNPTHRASAFNLGEGIRVLSPESSHDHV